MYRHKALENGLLPIVDGYSYNANSYFWNAILKKPQRGEGFSGQDMYVIPRPTLARACQHPLVRSVYPTDIGWFPDAAHHYRSRAKGAGQDHLIFCTSGHGSVVIEDQQVDIKEGELVIIPRAMKHSYWAGDDPWSIYWVHYLGDDADYFADRIPRVGQPVPVDKETQIQAEQLFRSCLNALHDGYGLPNLIYASQSVQHILALLLFRNPALSMDQRSRSRRPSIDAVIEFMQQNLHKPLRLNDFVRVSGISVSHFSDRFRAQTGQSPMAYFIHLKMRRASRLLDLSDRPIKSVAIETGYRDPYYFSRVFKKSMGVSPEHYRGIKKG